MRKDRRFHAFSFALVAATASAEPLSLRKALELAAHRSPDVGIATAQEEEASANVQLAYSEFWPKVHAVGSYQIHREGTTDSGGITGETTYDFNSKSTYSLALGANIFNSFASLNNLNSALALRNAAVLQREKAAQNTRFTTIHAYFGAVAYAEQSHYLKELVVYLSETNRKINDAFKAQAISKKEQVAVNYLLRDIKLKSFEADSSLKKNLRYLGDLIGQKDLKEHDLIDDIRTERRAVPKGETILGRFRSVDPEIRARSAIIDSFDYRRKAVMARDFPRVELEARYGENGSFVGLGVTVPIFSGFSSFAQRRLLAAQKSKAIVEKARYESSWRELVNRLVDEMNIASTNISFLTESVKDANAIWKITNRSYRLSATEATEWEAALKRLVNSEIDMIKNLLVYRVSEASLREIESYKENQ